MLPSDSHLWQWLQPGTGLTRETTQKEIRRIRQAEWVRAGISTGAGTGSAKSLNASPPDLDLDSPPDLSPTLARSSLQFSEDRSDALHDETNRLLLETQRLMSAPQGGAGGARNMLAGSPPHLLQPAAAPDSTFDQSEAAAHGNRVLGETDVWLAEHDSNDSGPRGRNELQQALTLLRHALRIDLEREQEQHVLRKQIDLLQAEKIRMEEDRKAERDRVLELQRLNNSERQQILE